MAAGDKIQVGTAFKVEYGGFTLAGFQPSNIQRVLTGEVNTITDERGADKTYIISNRGERLILDLMVEATANLDLIKVGDILSITPPDGQAAIKYINLTEAPITYTNDVTMVRLTLERKESMGAVLDADS